MFRRQSYDTGRFRRGRSFGDDLRPMDSKNPPITEFRKDFYEPIEEISKTEADDLRNEWEMILKGESIPPPVKNFQSIGFKKCILDFFNEKGFTAPTPIQAQGWPMALGGRDMVGIADTGSGKTLSFLVPALIHIAAQPAIRQNDGPIGLVLAPTRELVTQIETVCYDLNKFFGLRSLAVYGGVSIVNQKRKIIDGVDIIIATPGRLIDLHEQGFCPLDRVTFLVLDEADRMLDMGFEDQINRIIPKTNPGRQTLMWSATWPKEVKELAYNYTSKDHIQVNIGSTELKVNSKIEQKVEVVSCHDKEKELGRVIEEHMSSNGGKVIIFANTKARCNKLEYLISDRYKAAAIHGDKSQAARETIIDNFRKNIFSILVATDVAARGLDIRDVKLVVNFDLPISVEDYVHRVGRTCRGSEKDGKSLSFFSPEEDSGNAKKYIEIFKQGNVQIPNEIFNIADRNRGRSHEPSRYSRSGRNRNYARNDRYRRSYDTYRPRENDTYKRY